MRIYKLDKVPFGFFCDEAERGVSAYSLLKSGKDWHGEKWPIFFKAFGEYVGPVQTYSMIPFVFFFGKNEVGVRMTSAFWSIMGIIGMYLLVESFFKNWGIVGALIMTVLPWSIHYARYGAEISAYLTFFIFGLWTTLTASKKPKRYLLAGFCWALFAYAYTPAYLFSPLIWYGSNMYYLVKKKIDWRWIITGNIVYFLFMVPFGIKIWQGEILTRFREVTIGYHHQPLLASIAGFASRYLYQLSPRIFLEGEKTFITRHFIEGFKSVPYFVLILSLIGFFWLLSKKEIGKICWLIFLYPIGGAVPTDGGPLTTRSIIGIVPIVILSTSGLYFLWNLNRHFWFKIFLSTLFVALIISHIFSFWYFYFYIYPQKSSDFWGWQYGPKEILKIFKENEGRYQQFMMSREFNSPEIFIGFYYPECKNCVFSPDLSNNFSLHPKTMFAFRPHELTLVKGNYKILNYLYYPNGEIAFLIGETL